MLQQKLAEESQKRTTNNDDDDDNNNNNNNNKIKKYETRHSNGRTMPNIRYNSKIRGKTVNLSFMLYYYTSSMQHVFA